MKLVAFMCAAMALGLPGIAVIATDTRPVIQRGTVNSDMPPVRFQDNNVAVVQFTDQAGIHKYCGTPEPGFQIIACRRQAENGASVLFMPNPCLTGGLEFYAKIACHELGHVNGWSADHEL